jgi:hypothetical protein
MKRTLLLMSALALIHAQAPGKARDYQRGTVLSMNLVPCGTQMRRHKRTESLLCHEYVLRSGNIDYHIQQRLGKNIELLPLGVQAEFRIEKDHMFVRAPVGQSKERQFLVVSEAANNNAEDAVQR